MEKTMEELKLEADELGIEYPGNISKAKLQGLIDAYDAKIEAEIAPVKTEVKEEVVVEEKKVDPKIAFKIASKKRQAELLESVIIKLSMIDKREASTATSVYISNGHVSRWVPLDIYVEVPKVIAILADKAQALAHVEQNGVTTKKLQKKYVVEYKNKR